MGHVVGGDGIETDPDKIAKVRDWPTPKNPEELRSFLAFTGYYRRFIKDFSKITRPLADLIPPITKKKGLRTPTKEWHWMDTEQQIFDDLKTKLTSPLILAYPDFNLPFELHTDVSTMGLGAVLYQDQDGRKRVIAYASRSLSKSEMNYSVFKLEFLCLKWAVTIKVDTITYLQTVHVTVSVYLFTCIVPSCIVIHCICVVKFSCLVCLFHSLVQILCVFSSCPVLCPCYSISLVLH